MLDARERAELLFAIAAGFGPARRVAATPASFFDCCAPRQRNLSQIQYRLFFAVDKRQFCSRTNAPCATRPAPAEQYTLASPRQGRGRSDHRVQHRAVRSLFLKDALLAAAIFSSV